MAQAPSFGNDLQVQGSNRVETLLKMQRDDGMWPTEVDSTYTTALCSLALLSELESAKISERQGDLLRQRILKALDSIHNSSPTDGNSAASYLRALALYYGWELLGGDNLKVAAEAAIHSLTTPTNTHAQLTAIMFLLSSASQEYARTHGATPDKQTTIRTFDFLDRTLPPSYEQTLRLHLRTVIFWSGSQDRPLANLLPECWNMITHKADALQRAPVHIRDDAFLLLTANTFIFRKIGPGAGMYRSLTHDILQWKPASTVDGGVAPEIDLRGL